VTAEQIAQSEKAKALAIRILDMFKAEDVPSIVGALALLKALVSACIVSKVPYLVLARIMQNEWRAQGGGDLLEGAGPVTVATAGPPRELRREPRHILPRKREPRG
jgi:hypothetical protein